MFALTCEWMEMGHFQALPDVVAVAADRLVAIVRVELDGSVVVRDLANGVLKTTSASELSAPASLVACTETTLLSVSLQSVSFALSFCQRRIRARLDARRFHSERLLAAAIWCRPGPPEFCSFQLAQPCIRPVQAVTTCAATYGTKPHGEGLCAAVSEQRSGG